MGAGSGVAVVKLDDLTVAFRRHPALHHISGQFANGSLTAVTGPNGAGKSTLLKSILGLLPLTSGSVRVAPDLRRIAYLPQQSEIERSFPILVRDCILLGYWQQVGQFGAISSALMARAESTLDAFGYLGARYRITFLAPQGTSTESEASAKDVAKLISQIRRERIKSVHVENMSNPKMLQQLSREAGVAMGAKLYSDALSDPQGPAPTYLRMMRYNVEQLILGLQQN